ncbi:transketolase-like TK C-terminal-containing protein, partial [Listeria monocytogenes]|uniref:transketolase-like TK C-terminal-containing protein n=1 Tax=Listeria monocytogenes TaxID=1639 RepID=UPI000A5DC435
PGLSVIRPADGNHVVEAWKLAITSTSTPHVLVFTRQGLTTLPNSAKLTAEGVKKGAYVISPTKGDVPEAIILASGSEVSLAIEAQKELQAQGTDVSVVSVPSFDLFEQQSAEYKES